MHIDLKFQTHNIFRRQLFLLAKYFQCVASKLTYLFWGLTRMLIFLFILMIHQQIILAFKVDICQLSKLTFLDCINIYWVGKPVFILTFLADLREAGCCVTLILLLLDLRLHVLVSLSSSLSEAVRVRRVRRPAPLRTAFLRPNKGKYM